VAALQEQDPTLDLHGMFFAIQTQLLLSNLEQSLLQYPLTPPPQGKLTTLPADPTVVHDVVLFGPEKKDALLVQIISISEFGHSAFQTRNTMEQRKEALSGVGRIRRIRDHADPNNGNNVNGDQAPDEEDNEPDDVPPYPRSMLMLDVSDGFRVMRAMEYRRIDALKLGETSLGAKVRTCSDVGDAKLTGCSCCCGMFLFAGGCVRTRRNRCSRADEPGRLPSVVLLTPENTEFRGHMVEEFEDLQPILFQNGLLRRMG
jgi:RecQ-mediated genome instability protein 1